MAREFDALVEQELRRRTGLGANPYDLPGYGSATPPPPQMASSGQRYKDLPFDERFGGPYPYQRDPEEIKRRFQEELLIDRIQKDREAPGQTPGQMIRPGYQERFRDTSKVISMNGVALPEGFSLEPPKAQSAGIPLPEGFSTEKPTQQPAPVSPLQGVPLSADPAEQAREVAALRLSRGQRPPEGRTESGPSEFVGGLKAGFNQFMRDAGGKLQEPENALPAALGGPLAPGIGAMRGGAALTRAISERGIAPGADQAAAGKAVSEGVAAGGATVTPRMELLANQDSIGQMASMARTGSPEDLKALARLRRVVPEGRQTEVQGALVQRLGEGENGEFSAGSFIRRYGEVSDRAKNILFGEGGQGSLRHHLDSIAEVTERVPTWRGPSGRTIAGMATAASGVGALAGGTTGAILAPLAVLGAVLPVKTVAMALTSPATAASVAAWSRAYERVVRSGGNAAIVGFNLATRNLNNTLGVNVNPQDALGGARGQPVE